MTNRTLPIVSDVSIGNANAIIDCEWLKCIQSFAFTYTMEEVPIICNWADGKVTSLRGNPTGDITIEAMNLSSDTLKWALDAVVSTKSGDAAVTCVKVEGLEWTPDDVGTPTEWTTTIRLNTPNIENFEVFTDSACTSDWDSATTPLNVITVSSDCYGLITLTTDDVDECDETLYVTFDYDVDYADGTTVISPDFGTFAQDHLVIAWHLNATSGEYYVYNFPRCQIIPTFSHSFNNGSGVVITTIKLSVLADNTFHPTCPLGWIDISDSLPAYLAALIA